MAAHKGKTVRQLEAEMGSDELSGWLAYEQEYGYPDLYFAVGQVCRTLVGALTGKATSPADYVPFFRPPPRAQTPAEARAIVHAHVAAARAKKASGRV